MNYFGLETDEFEECDCLHSDVPCRHCKNIIEVETTDVHKSYWCDWCEETKIVKFGGFWWNVLNYKSSNSPDQNEILKYVERFKLTEGLLSEKQPTDKEFEDFYKLQEYFLES